MAIVLYELGGKEGQRYSQFSWRTRLALAHKGLDFDTVPVAVSDKAAIAFSGQTKVPILKDGETVVSDSWKIAEHLEQAYPDRPSLFGGERGQALARFVNIWADRQLVATAGADADDRHTRDRRRQRRHAYAQRYRGGVQEKP